MVRARPALGLGRFCSGSLHCSERMGEGERTPRRGNTGGGSGAASGVRHQLPVEHRGSAVCGAGRPAYTGASQALSARREAYEDLPERAPPMTRVMFAMYLLCSEACCRPEGDNSGGIDTSSTSLSWARRWRRATAEQRFLSGDAMAGARARHRLAPGDRHRTQRLCTHAASHGRRPVRGASLSHIAPYA